jgi:CBS domain-containing protein
MQARDVMTSPVVTVRPATPVRQAAALLIERGFTALPVVDEYDALVGIVTEADLLHGRIPPDPRSLMYADRAAAAPESTAPAPVVGDVMTTEVFAMQPWADAAELARQMLDRQLRSVPVLDHRTLIGIVSRRDLLRAMARDDTTVRTEVLRRLHSYAPHTGWQVECDEGVVTVAADLPDEQERHVASVLAGSVPGVERVTVTGVVQPA